MGGWAGAGEFRTMVSAKRQLKAAKPGGFFFILSFDNSKK